MPSGGCVCGNVRYEVQGDSGASVCIMNTKSGRVLIALEDSLPLCRLPQDQWQHVFQQLNLLGRRLQGHQRHTKAA